MNESESAVGQGVEELREEVHSLRTMLSVSLILLIIIGLCLDAYLMKQGSMAGGEARQLQAYVSTLNTQRATEFWLRLNEYARTHPDFIPIVTKYHPFISQTVLSAPQQAPRK